MVRLAASSLAPFDVAAVPLIRSRFRLPRTAAQRGKFLTATISAALRCLNSNFRRQERQTSPLDETSGVILAYLHPAWYFWIALVVILASSVALTVLCILCCRRPRRKSPTLCVPAASLPAAAMRTTQDAEGIIHPDVAFRTATEATGAPAPLTEMLMKADDVLRVPADPPSGIITPSAAA
ncbi:hypothetical protein MRX96_043055 [Rhipicephalus microplus]